MSTCFLTEPHSYDYVRQAAKGVFAWNNVLITVGGKLLFQVKLCSEKKYQRLKFLHRLNQQHPKYFIYDYRYIAVVVTMITTYEIWKDRIDGLQIPEHQCLTGVYLFFPNGKMANISSVELELERDD